MTGCQKLGETRVAVWHAVAGNRRIKQKNEVAGSFCTDDADDGCANGGALMIK